MHSMGYLLKEGLKSLWKNRTMSIASIGVLISCLLLTGIAMLLSLNLSTTMESVESTNSILVFLKEDVPLSPPCASARRSGSWTTSGSASLSTRMTP